MSTAPNGFQTPKTNWQAADVPTPTDFNRIEGNLQAIEEGSRTVDQTQSPSGLAGSLRQFLDWISNRIKAILGTTNWYDSPPVTLTVAKNHIDNKSNPHSVTAAQVGAATSSHVGATGTAHGVATTSVAGFMSASDKTALGNKVDKPASAVSGNIAVFDGGAGKLKDGGKPTYEVIADVNVTTNTAQIDILIDTTYRYIQLFITPYGTSDSLVDMLFNNDASSSYMRGSTAVTQIVIGNAYTKNQTTNAIGMALTILNTPYSPKKVFIMGAANICTWVKTTLISIISLKIRTSGVYFAADTRVLVMGVK